MQKRIRTTLSFQPNCRKSFSVYCFVGAIALPGSGHAEIYSLPELLVTDNPEHSTQTFEEDVNRSQNSARSSSSTGGAALQNLNPMNTNDSLRLTTPGLINTPGNGRFDGPTQIRVFGNFRSGSSIDGLPSVLFQAAEGGGYSNFRIPTIAIDRIDVLKGGRAVEYGDNSEGGIFVTRLKSGQNYDNHGAISSEFSNAGESILQGEVADSTENYDVYLSGSYLYGDFDGLNPPSNLDQQRVGSTAGKLGINISDKSRLEFTGIYSDSKTDMFRNNAPNEVSSESLFLAGTLSHNLNDQTNLKIGYLRSDSSSLWPARDRDRAIVIDTVFADALFKHDLSKSLTYSGSLGTEYARTNNLRDNSWDNTFDDYSLKWRNALTLNENTIFTVGLRNTWFNNEIVLDKVEQPDNLANDSVFSWEAGVAHSITESTRLRASVATGYSRFYSIYGNFGTDALNPAGAQDEIVESLSYEVGINQAWATTTLDVSLYSITQDNVPRRNNGAIQNVDVEQAGLEATVRSAITDTIFIESSYTHLFGLNATRDDGTDANGNIFYGENGVNVASDQLTLQIDWRATNQLSLWAAGIYGTPFDRKNADGSEDTRRSAYQRLDIGAGLRITDKASARVRFENLTDEKDFGSTLEGEPVNTEGKLGRVAWVGFDYTF
ncbi:TonB-dependent receptor [Marinobacter sp. 1-4A]|uniref:TonB-dependent receptor plug domain-containing protein n=1 Tax=Marinobacter sp. 1-4A TaxID=2582919 RepID=UPI001907057B|nr:TonB-dependent receptor [Marinobacter sp. 1-4A]MBK1852052.1 TonB-dependent receptor [Marinobacter sp. 1-4A]